MKNRGNHFGDFQLQIPAGDRRKTNEQYIKN